MQNSNFLTTDQARKILIDIPERTAYTEGHKVWTTLSTRDSKMLITFFLE